MTSIIGLVAASGGAGRTGAATNLAWILTSAGKRVLVIDWGTEGPSVHDYLRPFLVTESPAADFWSDGDPVAYPSRTPATLREYLVPLGSRRVHVLTDDDGGIALTGQDIAKWRLWLLNEDYDFVLIDGPTDVTPDGLSQVAKLCDTGLLFFLPRRTDIERAGEVAAGLAGAAVTGLGIVPVVSQFDWSRAQRATRSMDLIQETFAELHAARGPHYEPVVLPYRSYHEYDEALAVLIDEPGVEGTLLAAYERLTSLVSGGEVTAAVPVPPATRDRYRDRLDPEKSSAVWRMVVTHSVADRPWADWVRQRLERAGVAAVLSSPERVLPADAEVSGLIRIVSESPDPAEEARAAEVLHRLGGRALIDVVDVVVPRGYNAGLTDGIRPVGPQSATDRIIVGSRHELDVGSQLLARFGLFDDPSEEGKKAAIRFPGDAGSPELSNLPPRQKDFVGRDAEMERLRDGMTAAEPGPVWVCAGPSGAGKSDLAREYAHRFGFHYDRIWWMSAHNAIATRAGLLRLADGMSDLEAGEGAHDAIASLFSALSSPKGKLGRSLLIYDNVTDLDRLAELGLVPSHSAIHVLITTGASPSPAWHVLDVGMLSQDECVALLGQHVPGLAASFAARISDALRCQSLAVRLAAGWLTDAVALRRATGMVGSRAAEQAATELVDLLPRFDNDDEVLAVTFEVVRPAIARSANGAIALRVAEMCAHLSPEGVSLKMLRSDAFVSTIVRFGDPGAARLLLDAGEIDQVLWTGASYGLYGLSWGQASALLNRPALQTVLRARAGAEEAREATLAALAAYAPKEDTPWTEGKKAKHEELQRHIFNSGALHSTDPAVRRWLVNHLTFLFLTNEGMTWRFARERAAEVVEEWRAAVGNQDELVLRMRGQLANLHRAIGEFDIAERIDEEVLDSQRRVLGNRHLQTLVSARSRAADLRSLGRYDEAYADDQEAYHGLRDLLGEDHPQTRVAKHNLAISAYLTGDMVTALRHQREHRANQARLLGRNDVTTWKSAASEGVYLREIGLLQEAANVLGEARDQVALVRGDTRHPDLLWIDWQVATVRRRQGNHYRSKEINARTARAYQDLFGMDHPNTRSCRLSLATDHHACGDHDTAVIMAKECLVGYERVAADHPVTAVCRMNLALYLRAAGQVQEALGEGKAAMDMLIDQLGMSHPWAMIATANHAVALAISGDMSVAEEIAGENDEFLGDLLGSYTLGFDHPYRVASAKNLTRIRAGATDGEWHEMSIDVLPM